MSDQNLKNLQAAPVVLPNAARPPIGQCLLNDGVISKQQLDTALSRQGWLRAPLGVKSLSPKGPQHGPR